MIAFTAASGGHRNVDLKSGNKYLVPRTSLVSIRYMYLISPYKIELRTGFDSDHPCWNNAPGGTKVGSRPRRHAGVFEIPRLKRNFVFRVGQFEEELPGCGRALCAAIDLGCVADK